MGIRTRRGIAAAALAASAAMVFTTAAGAAVTDPYHDDVDWTWQTDLTTVDGNNKVHRAAGRDRIETAIQLMCHATDHAWKGVIIARSDDFADALTAGPLADVRDYALLTMPSGKIDPRVVSAINSNCNRFTQGKFEEKTNINQITLIGGTGIWTEAQRAQLQNATGKPVDRISGINRYDTAVEIAGQVAKEIWKDKTDEDGGINPPLTVNAYVATGMDFADALAAGAAASANDGVVLLTNGSLMHDKTEAYLDKQYEWMPSMIGHIEHHAVGGPAKTAMDNADIRVDKSYVGSDRYATAVLLAKSYAKTAKSITIASGENYADAVVAGAFAANHDGPLVLTRNAFLSPVTRDYLRFDSDLHAEVMVVGGEGSVSRAVSTEVMAALKF